MTTDWAQQKCEMDSLVKELYGLVPETPVETEIQKLRQRVVDALEKVQAYADPIASYEYEVQLEKRGIQLGSIATLKTVLDWIDEIVAEGK